MGAMLETTDFWQVQLFTKYLIEASYWFQVAEMHCAGSYKKGFIVKNQGCFMAPQKKMKWQPTPVFLPGESHGQRGLTGTVHGVSGSWTQLSDFHFTSEEDELSDILKTVRTSYFSILLLPRRCDILSLSSFWTLIHSSPEDCFSVLLFFFLVSVLVRFSRKIEPKIELQASLLAQLVKEPAYNAGDHGLIPGLRISPREGIGYPLQYSWWLRW